MSENNIFGRKIFFIDPPTNISTLVIPLLTEQEYEIYTVQTYKRVKPLLKMYPNAIVFINPEDEMSTNGWISLIQTIQSMPEFSEVVIGVLARAIRKADRDRFMEETKLEGGFIQVTPDKDALTNQFLQIFAKFEAKGRRKFIRANCKTDNSVFGQATIQGRKVRFDILDISSVGICATVPKDFAPYLPAKTILPDFTLLLHNTEIKIGAVVIVVRPDATENLALVMLFRSGMSTNIKNTIREYVFNTLNRDMKASVTDDMFDQSNYDTPVNP